MKDYVAIATVRSKKGPKFKKPTDNVTPANGLEPIQRKLLEV